MQRNERTGGVIPALQASAKLSAARRRNTGPKSACRLDSAHDRTQGNDASAIENLRAENSQLRCTILQLTRSNAEIRRLLS
jgi:hypothetical protein